VIEIKSRWGDGKVLYTAKTAADIKAALEEAVLGGAYLGGANLGGAYLRDAYLGGANLGGANLGGANLGGANLRGAYLRDAYLRGAYLGGANLGDANLGDANLRDAYLRDAYLGGAYLGGANLGDANLRGVNLGGAKGLNVHGVNDLLLLLDQPGKIRAYKLVNEGGEGPFNGGIYYELGGSYEVPDANTDPATACAAGINLATLPWCIKEWQPGYRILVAEFKAVDIAAIPVGDGKFRVHRCKIVGEKDLEEIGLVVKPELVKVA
jgi:uncharacterized protein YjbI with pentapeptide repeats